MRRSLFALPLFVVTCSQPPDIAEHRAPSVVVEEVKEQLFSVKLQELICAKLPLPGVECAALTFEVTEAKRSSLYFKADGTPLTMELTVSVHDPETDAEFEAVLTRSRVVDHELRFTASVNSTSEDHHTVIRELAREAGEYLPFEDLEGPATLVGVDKASLPAKIRKIVDATLAEHIAGVQEFEPTGGAFPHDELPYAEIRLGDDVIGYFLSVHDAISHPLWDGSGTHYYFDASGFLVTWVNWAG